MLHSRRYDLVREYRGPVQTGANHDWTGGVVSRAICVSGSESGFTATPSSGATTAEVRARYPVEGMSATAVLGP